MGLIFKTLTETVFEELDLGLDSWFHLCVDLEPSRF
jgi:hypothetical protein